MFEHLEKVKLSKNVTAEYHMSQIEIDGKIPVLTVKPATDLNSQLTSALLKKQKTSRKRKIDVRLLEESRQEDRELYSKYVIVDWKNVIKIDGKEAPFTQQNCLKFLEAISDWIFDELRAFCGKGENFGNNIIDTEEIAGNSQSD